jgi:hypothetical protein
MELARVPSSQRMENQSDTFSNKKKSKAFPIVIASVVAVAIIAVAVFVFVNLFEGEAGRGAAGGEESPASSLEQAATPSIEKVGDRVEFGTWRGEPITWRVLAIEGGRALIISEDILTLRQYDDLGVSSSALLPDDESTVATTWAESDIRAWLNDEFLDTAFTREQQEVVDLSRILTPDNPENGVDGGADTKDRITVTVVGSPILKVAAPALTVASVPLYG